MEPRYIDGKGESKPKNDIYTSTSLGEGEKKTGRDAVSGREVTRQEGRRGPNRKSGAEVGVDPVLGWMKHAIHRRNKEGCQEEKNPRGLGSVRKGVDEVRCCKPCSEGSRPALHQRG